MFVEAFALGYTYRKKIELKKSPKETKKEKVVMALKETALVLSGALSNSNDDVVKKELIERSLIDKLNRGEAHNISVDVLTNAFSHGDFRKSKGLRLLKMAVMSKKNN